MVQESRKEEEEEDFSDHLLSSHRGLWGGGRISRREEGFNNFGFHTSRHFAKQGTKSRVILLPHNIILCPIVEFSFPSFFLGLTQRRAGLQAARSGAWVNEGRRGKDFFGGGIRQNVMMGEGKRYIIGVEGRKCRAYGNGVRVKSNLLCLTSKLVKKTCKKTQT